MKIIKLTVGQLASNCYIVFDEESKEAWIIDPGDDAEYIQNTISDNDLRPAGIIATHGHFDHIMAAMEIQLAYKIPFYIHEDDKFLVEQMQSSAKHWLGIDAGPPPRVDFNLEPGHMEFGNWNLEIIPTPGHTPGSVSLYSKNSKTLFVGDLIFEGGAVGRTDFKYCDHKKLLSSIQKVLKLDKDTLVYAGHGEPFLLSDFANTFSQNY